MMFETENVSKQYAEEFALRDITMSIGKGMNFIIGASGSGKTTLLKILCGMEQGFEGCVTYCGKNIDAFSAKEKSSLYNMAFGFVWQDFHLLEEATVLDNIMLPEYIKTGKSQNTAERILRQLKLEDLREQKVRWLSGGQKQRVAIARELMKNPNVIFCDEPTSALDAKSAQMIMEILRTLSKNRTVIVVTHDTSLITEKDYVYELDKGELISKPTNQPESKTLLKIQDSPALSFKNAFRIAFMNLKNKFGRFIISALSLMIAGTLMLATVSGAIGSSGQSEFDKLFETYGESILDIGLVGSFMSASGTDGADKDKPNGDVTQDLSGLYEKYQNDERVEFIVSMQPFENIQVDFGGKKYPVTKTGNSPVLTKLVSGSIPSGEEFQVVVPQNFIKSIGLTEESALGKEIEFSATVFQWINEQPIEKPIHIRAVICGVADNTVVYDYQGQTGSFAVDDSFFFNRAAEKEIRKQAGIEKATQNFTMRAKTPEALIALKDELNRNGIVPLGRFELVEDIVRLNQQTTAQSGSASAVIGILAAILVAVIFSMTAVIRRREYAIYKICGYCIHHLCKIAAMEMVLSCVSAVLLMLIFSPLLNMAAEAMFGASILSAGKLAIGVLLTVGASILSFVAHLPILIKTDVSTGLKAGDKS